MRNRLVPIVVLLPLAVALLPAGSASGAEKLKCAECGMLVEATSPFAARAAAGGKDLWFCDIGDLLLYLKEKKADTAQAQVKDYRTGAWIAVAEAFYVHAPKKFTTPMGWNIAAFRNRTSASEFGETEDFTAIMQLIK